MKMAPRNDRLPTYDDASVQETTPQAVDAAFADRPLCPDCFGWPCVCARLVERRLARRYGRRSGLRRLLRSVTRRRKSRPCPT